MPQLPVMSEISDDTKVPAQDLAGIDAPDIEEEDVGKHASKGIQFMSSISNNEPIVTRRELWSYYRVFPSRCSLYPF